MGKNHFTEEQQEQLRANKYIKNVSAKAITYKQEFHELFTSEYYDGKPPSTILRDMGINPQLLGKRRKDAIVAAMHKHELRPEGCEDKRAKNSGRPVTRDLSDAERIERLEHRVQYLKQENEFLKKIEFLDRQASWKEKQKQRQKKSLNLSRK
ncbi:MAG: hypothetical protein RSA29_07450 [Clostridium sp.]